MGSYLSKIAGSEVAGEQRTLSVKSLPKTTNTTLGVGGDTGSLACADPTKPADALADILKDFVYDFTFFEGISSATKKCSFSGFDQPELKLHHPDLPLMLSYSGFGVWDSDFIVQAVLQDKNDFFLVVSAEGSSPLEHCALLPLNTFQEKHGYKQIDKQDLVDLCQYWQEKEQSVHNLNNSRFLVIKNSKELFVFDENEAKLFPATYLNSKLSWGERGTKKPPINVQEALQKYLNPSQFKVSSSLKFQPKTLRRLQGKPEPVSFWKQFKAHPLNTFIASLFYVFSFGKINWFEDSNF